MEKENMVYGRIANDMLTGDKEKVNDLLAKLNRFNPNANKTINKLVNSFREVSKDAFAIKYPEAGEDEAFILGYHKGENSGHDIGFTTLRFDGKKAGFISMDISEEYVVIGRVERGTGNFRFKSGEICLPKEDFTKFVTSFNNVLKEDGLGLNSIAVYSNDKSIEKELGKAGVTVVQFDALKQIEMKSVADIEKDPRFQLSFEKVCERNAYEQLSKSDQQLVTKIERWAKDNNIRNDKDFLLLMNRNSKNPVAAKNALVNAAVKKGFELKKSKENER